MPKQKKGTPRAKPYEKPTSEQTDDDTFQKETDGEQRQNGEEINTCCICDKNITEDTEDSEGEEAIYCEGICKSWVHRKCAGLSNTWFTKLSTTNKPFICIYCMLFEQISTIQELKEDIKSLKINYTEPSHNTGTKPPENMEAESPAPSPTTLSADLEKINSQLNQLTNSVLNHQKLLENKEKVDRMNNLIIVGLDENGEAEDTISITNKFFSQNLDLTDTKIERARRLGKTSRESKAYFGHL